MDILKVGRLPPKKVGGPILYYHGTCSKCAAEIRCNETELVSTWNHGACGEARCPTDKCGGMIQMSVEDRQ